MPPGTYTARETKAEVIRWSLSTLKRYGVMVLADRKGTRRLKASLA